MLLYGSGLSTLEKVEIMDLMLAKGARMKEGALAAVLETFILEVEGSDRVLGLMLRTISDD